MDSNSHECSSVAAASLVYGGPPQDEFANANLAPLLLRAAEFLNALKILDILMQSRQNWFSSQDRSFSNEKETHWPIRFPEPVRFNWITRLFCWTAFNDGDHGKSPNVCAHTHSRVGDAYALCCSDCNSYCNALRLSRVVD